MAELDVLPAPGLAEPTASPDPTPYERYLDVMPDGMKGDLVDGEIIIDVSTTILHETIQAFLSFLLQGYTGAKGLGGVVLGSRTTVKVNDENGFEPDVLYVRQDRLGLLGYKDVQGAPDLAVEIVSRTSGTRDRETKFEGYQRLGVPEYWLVDPARREAAFYRLHEGRYRAAPLQAGMFVSEAVPGFRLDPALLFQSPLPSGWDVLRGMLGEGPA